MSIIYQLTHNRVPHHSIKIDLNRTFDREPFPPGVVYFWEGSHLIFMINLPFVHKRIEVVIFDFENATYLGDISQIFLPPIAMTAGEMILRKTFPAVRRVVYPSSELLLALQNSTF